MKKQTLYLFILSAILVGIVLFNKSYDSKAESIAELREQHKSYLSNSPFKETLNLSKKERKAMGIPPNKYFEREWELTMDPSTGKPHPDRLFALQESLKKNNIASKNPGSASWNKWEERGPDNVGGRTRAIMFDPNDATNKRVFAGGVSGGLWLNEDITDENSAWALVDIPQNLAVSVLTYDPNNKNIFYLGTGESYVAGDANGNGMWKSMDAGATWNKVFGGITGETTFKTNAKLTVNSPASFTGEYMITKANFGPKLTTLTGNLALASDGTANSSQACNSLTNGSAISGNIAVIERGECAFVDKVKNAQNAGAIAVLIVNNVSGPPIIQGGDDTTITIPSVMISKDEGQTIIAELSNGVNVTIEPVDSPFQGNYVTPGIQHINDIKVRDNAGISEIYVAVGESFYSDSSPYSLLGVEDYGLYKSNDEAVSWEKLTMPLTNAGGGYAPNDLEIDTDNVLWVSTTKSILNDDGGGAILSSSDGVNFNLKYTVENGVRTQISVSKLNAGVVYVLAELSTDDEIYLGKTINAFTDVTDLTKPDDADNGIPANDFTRGQAFYDLMIEVDPSNDEIAYVGGIDLFRTDDSGTSWNQISKWSNNNNLGGLSIPMVHADQHIMVFDPSDSNKALFGNDGGVYYGSNLSNAASNNNAIETRNKNYNTLQFYKGAIGSEISNEKLLAGAQDNGSQFINSASSGINSSLEVSGGDGAYCFIDKDNEYMITSYVYNNYYYLNYSTGNYIYRIADDSEDGDFINPAELNSVDNILFTTGTDKINKYTLNSSSATSKALTNTLLTSNPTAFKSSTFNSQILYVGTETGELLKLENVANNNPTWKDISGDLFVGSISCVEEGETENDLFVTFHNYGVVSVYYSADGGETWQSKEGNLPDLPVKAILMSPINSNEVILGTDLGVWGTSNFNDANPTWEQSQNGMKDVKVTSFDLRTSDNTVLASTYGRGMFTAKFTVDDYYGDDDNDAVINGLDLCPDTAAGETVNSDGCSDDQLDDDEDGVQNSLDLCPDTAAGAVNSDGCSNDQLDDDEDGVQNSLDLCPNTPLGETVDSDGCSNDQQDDDGDGVQNSLDLCSNTPTGATVNSTGCIVLPNDNFNIEINSESCPDKDNGQIIIETDETYNYKVTINGADYTFESSKTIDNLAPGLYDFCITIVDDIFEQCFTIEIKEGSNVAGKSSITNNEASIEIENGTPPFAVYVNGMESFKTNTPKFSVTVNHGDVVEVKTAIACEGNFSKTFEMADAFVAYPNPTKGNLEISLPISDKDVTIEIFNNLSQLISKRSYPVVYGKVQLDLTHFF